MTPRKHPEPVKVRSRVRIMNLEAEGSGAEIASVLGAAVAQFFAQDEAPQAESSQEGAPKQ